jgi:hypothetical protein
MNLSNNKYLYCADKSQFKRLFQEDNDIVFKKFGISALTLILNSQNKTENLRNFALSFLLSGRSFGNNYIVLSTDTMFSFILNCRSDKYPFMSKNDIILSCLYGPPEVRGKRNGARLIANSLSYFGFSKIWYITDKTNFASKKTAIISGFTFAGCVRRNSFLSFSEIIQL